MFMARLTTPGRGTAAKGRGLAVVGQPGRAQHAIGLDNLLQTLLSAPIAAVCVGMKPLYEFLIPRLYLVQGGASVKIEHVQGALLRPGERPLRRLGLRPFLDVREQAEIVGELVCALAVAGPRRALA